MTEQTPIRLTQFSRGAGCGCKISPKLLQEILATSTVSAYFPNLLVGNETADDAAVFAWNETECLISTTDFFMPIVDDAFDFGQVAAANALSDVYAMGGEPMMAIAILGWPVDKLPAALAQQVLEGGRKICAAANIPLAGGHTIDSAEPFFGLAVSGRVLSKHLKQNNTAQVGDELLLTKPLGTGILTTAEKRDALSPAHVGLALQQMVQLNKVGAALASLPGVSAMTDVTGFGLAGHLLEMCGHQLSADLYWNKLPWITPDLKDYISKRILADAGFRNWQSYGSQIGFDKTVDVMQAFSLLPDPQTSGGLLVAVQPGALAAAQNLLADFGLADFQTPIGVMTERKEKTINVLTI
jgi:selenide, water dikinase